MKLIQNPQLRQELWVQSGLTPHFSTSPLEMTEVILFEKGEYLFQEGEPSPYLYIFVKGKLKVFTLSPQGKTVVYGFFHEPRIFGEVSAFGDAVHSVSVLATENTHCLRISLEENQSTLFEDKVFLQYNCKLLSAQVVSLDKRLADVIASSSESRLAAYLLQNVGEEGRLNFNLNETTEIIVTSYRHLLRVLEDFCHQGILQKEKQKYFLLDKEKLQDISSTFQDFYKN